MKSLLRITSVLIFIYAIWFVVLGNYMLATFSILLCLAVAVVTIDMKEPK